MKIHLAGAGNFRIRSKVDSRPENTQKFSNPPPENRGARATVAAKWFGHWVPGFGFRAQATHRGFGPRDLDSGFRVSGLGFRVSGLRLRVEG